MIEHQLANAKRCDITACIQTPDGRKMPVVEVKGQWNTELFTAASCQLSERYTIHPAAEEQGIYLVLWFGPHDLVEGRKNHQVLLASDLQEQLEHSLSFETALQILRELQASPQKAQTVSPAEPSALTVVRSS